MWGIPQERCDGYVGDLESGQVFGLLDPADPEKKGAIINLQDKIVPINNQQTWTRSPPDSDGWFLLIHESSRRVLTAQSRTKLTISGNKLFNFMK